MFIELPDSGTSNCKMKIGDGNSTYENLPYAMGAPENERSYVGMVIHSTTLDTEAKVKSFYGGITWIQHSGYFLRGASSGVSSNHTGSDGGQNTITPSGTNSGGTVISHTLTVNQIPSHSHYIVKQVDNNAGDSFTCGSGSAHIFYQNGNDVHTGATGGSQGHSHEFTQPTFKGIEHTNLPSYKNIYIWERTI